MYEKIHYKKKKNCIYKWYHKKKKKTNVTAVHFTRVRTLQNLARVEGRGKTVESLKRQTKDTISVEMSGGRVEAEWRWGQKGTPIMHIARHFIWTILAVEWITKQGWIPLSKKGDSKMSGMRLGWWTMMIGKRSLGWKKEIGILNPCVYPI